MPGPRAAEREDKRIRSQDCGVARQRVVRRLFDNNGLPTGAARGLGHGASERGTADLRHGILGAN